MGAGCMYKHSNGELACWIEIDPEDEFDYSDTLSQIGWELEKLGYYKEDSNIFKNKFFTVELKSTYYGDGILILLEARERYYSLAVANFNRCENRILKQLDKCGFVLKIATSGYTSQRVRFN